jgi:GR25 family glycosyltransferase involved in LPS biosynthesis
MEIQHTLYINLEERQDRRVHVEKQLESIGIHKPIRFNAMKMKDGRIGCSMSHLKCLQLAKNNNWSHVLIVEDDITFLDPEMFKRQLENFFQDKIPHDVLIFGGNVVPPYKQVNSYCVQVFSCQTTTGYLVKQHYYETLIHNLHEGLTKLMKEPKKHYYYAIDKYWFCLQRRDLWFIIVPLSVIQLPNYSNLEKRQTDYSRLMLDLDKTFLQNTRFIKPMKK